MYPDFTPSANCRFLKISSISTILSQPSIYILPGHTLPFLSSFIPLSFSCIPLNHTLVLSSPHVLQVVTLVVEREWMHLPRVSLTADTSSSVSNQSTSPATSPLRLNSCSSTSTPPKATPTRPKEYSFMTDGRRTQFRFRPMDF